MVRFQWHVEDGLGASVGPGQLVYLRDHGVLQAMVEIEMPGGSGSLEACMNIPQNYNTDSGVKELGIILAHGSDASDWRGRLLAELSVSLARAGFLVMRYICHPNATEARRVAVFEKAADAAATSPYARGVTRWVLAGLGGGARVAALAGGRVRSNVAGYALISYPLKEELPDLSAEATGAAPGAPPPADSSGPLLGLPAPMLFVSASTDPLVSEAALVELGPRMVTSDMRSVVLPDVDSHFRTLSGKGPHAGPVRSITAALHEFLNATNAFRMDYCKLPRIWRGGVGGAAPAAGVGESGGKAGRPQLQRPACFRPLPSGPPQHAQQQALAQQQQQQIAALPYGLSASTAQALAAQIHQRQAAAAAGGAGGAAAAQLLAQQVLLQQAAAATAAQRRTSADQADVGPASAAGKLAAAAAAAAAARGGAAGMPNAQLAGLAHMLSDPNAAAQIAAMLLRNSAAAAAAQQHQQQVLQLGDGAAGAGPTSRGGGGAGGGALLQALSPAAASAVGAGATAGGAGPQAITMEALTSALMQRLAQQPQSQLPSGTAGQLLAATLLNQQQQQQQQGAAAGGGAAGGGAAALQQQQLQQLLLQHQRQQQQQQQQRQQLTLQLQEQLLQRQQQQQQGLQPALLLQNNALQAALRPAARGAGGAGPGGVLMLHAAGSGQDGEDMHMADAGPS